MKKNLEVLYHDHILCPFKKVDAKADCAVYCVGKLKIKLCLLYLGRAGVV